MPESANLLFRIFGCVQEYVCH
nr:hypothetical protein [Allopseudospirillum japonicum]